MLRAKVCLKLFFFWQNSAEKVWHLYVRVSFVGSWYVLRYTDWAAVCSLIPSLYIFFFLDRRETFQKWRKHWTCWGVVTILINKACYIYIFYIFYIFYILIWIFRQKQYQVRCNYVLCTLGLRFWTSFILYILNKFFRIYLENQFNTFVRLILLQVHFRTKGKIVSDWSILGISISIRIV